MNSNQFRKACNTLFPNVVFHFSVSMFSFTALGQGTHEGINLFAKKDGAYITVQVNGSSTAVHDVYVLLNEVHAPELEDLLTTEQQQLEMVRQMLAVYKAGRADIVKHQPPSERMEGYKAGQLAERDLIIMTLEDILNDN